MIDSSENVLASSLSENLKNGLPFEAFTFAPVDEEEVQGSLVVQQYDSEGFSTACQKIRIAAHDIRAQLTHYSTPLRNIYGNIAASSTFAVAAVKGEGNMTFDESSEIAFFSSEGPPEICFNEDGSRTVMDGSSNCIERDLSIITASSGVSVTTPGFSHVFNSTGASAVVAGAITAVLLEAFPDLDRLLLLDAYNQTSTDILTEGFDTASGYGIIDALALFDFILEHQTKCNSYSDCPDGYICTCLSNGLCYCKGRRLIEDE